MIHSVRGRLTLWYGAVFAAFLVVFATAGYIFIRKSSLARIDEFLEETASAVSGAMEFERNAGETDSAAVAHALREFRLRETDVVVFDRATNVVSQARADVDPKSTSALVTTVPVITGIEALMRNSPKQASTLRTVHEGDEDLRLYTMPYTLGDYRLVIATVQRLRGHEKLLRETELILWFVLPLLVVLAAAGGYLLARKSLRPVANMTERAAAIGEASLHERLPVGNPRDELGRLASVFNDLLDRLERAFEERRRFMEDASHELRTPVAVISGESELALSRADRRPEELRDALTAVRAESRHLRDIVDDLFLLARSEAGARPMQQEELYLRDLVDDCVRAARSLAAAKHIVLTLEVGDDDLAFTGDEPLLKRLLMNLLDNAVKFTPDAGHIDVRVSSTGTLYVIDVQDSGPGVPVAARGRIFDRFYRASAETPDVARTEGAGLGLAIARWIARAHHGDLTLVNSGAEGSLFRVTLPAPSPVYARATDS
jgi:signal transduction histidine kinase